MKKLMFLAMATFLTIGAPCVSYAQDKEKCNKECCKKTDDKCKDSKKCDDHKSCCKKS